MDRHKVLVSDDERLAFAAELGWEDDDIDDDAIADEADEFFDFDRLTEDQDVDEDALDGVDQELLDEVRDAVVRRRGA